ncbi:MAG: hypothetical protein H3C54_07165, partial [Taibaiella sp.]|nr:hypothetical protein [Taibaiella sp.]
TGDYEHRTGGNADPMDKTIYSGNNSEFYPHELVHVYLTNIQVEANGTGNSTMAHEGISTYLGGSGGYTLDEHLHILADYARQNKLTTIDEILGVEGGMVGEKETDAMYTIGGLIAKITDKKAGYKGILELINIQEDDIYPFAAKMMGVKQEQAKVALMKELMKY